MITSKASLLANIVGATMLYGEANQSHINDECLVAVAPNLITNCEWEMIGNKFEQHNIYLLHWLIIYIN